MKKNDVVRKMQYAGSWYESDAQKLSRFLDEAIHDAAVVKERELSGACLAMLPHAGLFFSARGIAALFANLPVQAETFLIIAPSHYQPIPADMLTVSDFNKAETPLGNLETINLREQLPSRVVNVHNQAVALEHAVEMFLPFCAHFAVSEDKNVTVGMALVSGVTSMMKVDMLSEALLEAVDNEAIISGKLVIIASSDFTHYGRRFGHTPFAHLNSLKEAEQAVVMRDRRYARLFAENEVEKLMKKSETEKPTICGFAPGLITSAVAEKLGFSGKIADQYTSNTLTGPSDDFVSYCSILWR